MTRTSFGTSSSVITVADLELDTAGKTVKRGGREITLSAKEYSLLEYLMLNRGKILSRDKIEDHIWNFDYEGGTNVVDVYISYLRKKIDDGFDKKLIHTVREEGMSSGKSREVNSLVNTAQDNPVVCRRTVYRDRDDLRRDTFSQP